MPDGAHYGRVVRDEAGQVAAVLQAKDSEGPPRYPGHPGDQHRGLLFRGGVSGEGLAKFPKSPVTGEIYLTDLIHIARQQGRAVEALIDPDWEAFWGSTAGPNWPGPPRP